MALSTNWRTFKGPLKTWAMRTKSLNKNWEQLNNDWAQLNKRKKIWGLNLKNFANL